METIGWLFILTAALVLNGVRRGRSLSDIPGDLGATFTAAVTVDISGVKAALARTGDTQTPSDASTAPSSQSQTVAVSGTSVATGHADKAGLVAFGRQLQGMGYQVSEHPDFGGVHPVHVKGSKHYIGEAIDVNADHGFRGGEKPALDNANRMALAAGFHTLWQVPGHFNHLHVEVP